MDGQGERRTTQWLQKFGSADAFPIAVLGHGVNDLRPDPKVVPEDFAMSVGIP